MLERVWNPALEIVPGSFATDVAGLLTIVGDDWSVVAKIEVDPKEADTINES